MSETPNQTCATKFIVTGWEFVATAVGYSGKMKIGCRDVTIAIQQDEITHICTDMLHLMWTVQMRLIGVCLRLQSVLTSSLVI